MQIDLKYDLDLEEAFRKFDLLSNRMGTIEDALTGMRRQNPFVEANQSASQFNTTLGQQAQAYRRVQSTTEAFRQEQKRLENQLKELKSRQAEFIAAGKYGELKEKIAQTESQLRRLGDQLDNAKQKSEGVRGAFDKVGSAIKTAFTVTGILFLIEKIVELGQKVIEVTGSGERYQNQFTRIFEGNSQVAEGYLATLQKTADTTNFTFDELADNVAKLASRGIIPTEKELLKLGDTANFINKPFEQLNEAILDGSNPERWKELGFVVSTQGNKMTLSYGDFSKTVDKSVKGAYEAIQAFAEQGKVLGSTAEAGKTLSGRMSTLADNFAGIFRTIGQGNKGVLNDLLDLFSRILIGAKDLIKGIQPFAESFGGAFVSLVKAIGGALESLTNFSDATTSTATASQKFGFYLSKYIINPLTGFSLIIAGAIEGLNQMVLYTEYAAAKLTGKSSLAAALDQQLKDSKTRVAEIQAELAKVGKAAKQSLADYERTDNQRQRREDRRARLAQEASENFKPTPGKNSPTQVDQSVIKAQQEEYNLLLKTRDEYVKEYMKLDEQFGKDKLEALKKDEVAYITEKARLDKMEVDAEEAHLLKLLQLASSNRTQINKLTGQREVVADTSVVLPADIQRQFDDKRKQIDAEADRQTRIAKIRQQAELIGLEKQTNKTELELFDAYWEERLLKEGKNSALLIALTKKRDDDRNALIQDQLIRDQKAQEQISLYNIQLRTKGTGQTGTQFARTNQLDEIAQQLISAENQIFGLNEQNDPKNTPEIKRLEAYVKALKEKRKEIELLGPVNKDIWDLLGISKSFKDETERQVFLQGIDLISNAIQQATQAAVESSDARIQALDAQIQAKQEQVATEEERDKEGYANNLALRQAELDDLKRQKAEEEQVKRKALAVQQALDLASQVSNNAVTVSNTVTAISEMFKQYGKIPFIGVILALGAVATILGTIASVKAKAKALTQLRKGGRVPLAGRSHEQGGHRIEGTDIEVEAREHVTNAQSSDRFDKTLEAINENDPKRAFLALIKEGGFGLPQMVIQYMQGPDFRANSQYNMRLLEQRLDLLIEELRVVQKHTKPGKQYIGLGNGMYLEIDGTHKYVRKP
ncbi:hypothetical protein [Spirosoma litoris]